MTESNVSDEVEAAAKALYEDDDLWSASERPWPARDAEIYRRLAASALSAAAKVRAIREGDGLDTLLAQRQPSGLPKAYGGCTCSCHRTPGVMHIAPCCRPSDDTSPLITREWAERMIPLEDGVDVTNAPAMTPADNLEAGAGDLVEELARAARSSRRQAESAIRQGGVTAVLGEAYALGRAADLHDKAAAQLAAVTADNARLRDAIADLNVTDQELVRIHNMCTGFDGDVKIWAKMLHKLAVFALAARAALSQEAPK